jgi:general secretion pathway protein G
MRIIRHQQSGFTLIELTIVLVILGVLASLAYPAYANMVRRAKYAEVKQQMSSIGKELKLYQVEHGTFPPDVGRNRPPLGVVNWPTTVPYNSDYDYDHWRVGNGECYVQVGYSGESGIRAYPVHQKNAPNLGFEEFDDNLVLGVAIYACGLGGNGPVN